MWRALDGRLLYAQARTAGFLYQAELRHALDAVVGGVVGVPGRRSGRDGRVRQGTVCGSSAAAGSRSNTPPPRRGTIRCGRGVGSRSRTRRAKDYHVDPEQLRTDWERRADLHGVARGTVEELLTQPACCAAHCARCCAGTVQPRYWCRVSMRRPVARGDHEHRGRHLRSAGRGPDGRGPVPGRRDRHRGRGPRRWVPRQRPGAGGRGRDDRRAVRDGRAPRTRTAASSTRSKTAATAATASAPDTDAVLRDAPRVE